jgi:outer membrane receptor protein involved in Fe transport
LYFETRSFIVNETTVSSKEFSMLRRTTASVVFLISILCTLPVLLNGQDVTAGITGIVKDSSGGVVPTAKITATNAGTQAHYNAVADQTGAYTFRALPVGTYNLQADVAGFKRFEAKGVRLQVNEVARVDMALEVGTATETVSVAAQAVSVDTSSPTLQTVVDQKRIEELPLNGRNATQLMRLVAGVVSDPRADVTSGTTYPGVTPVSVNGSRANSTNYVLDGAQNNDHYTNAPNPMPNPDALQEFSVQTNNFSAEFGRQSGGVVNAITKSGTNDLHGSAFEFVRNNALNAANYFAPIVNGKKQSDGLKRNQFGATLGGPVWLPKLYDGHDKTFFFASYQGTLERRAPTSSNIVVPTAAQRNGDFSSLKKKLKDPFTGDFYKGNQIPAAEMNPVSQNILQYIPAPTAGNRISVAPPNNDDDHQVLARIDHQISDANRISGRFWNSKATTPAYLNPQNYLEQNTGRLWLNRSVSINDTHIFSPKLLNEALFSFNRTDGNNIPVYPPSTFSDLGIDIYNDAMPQYYVAVNGYWGTLNTGDTNRFLRDEYQAIDTLRWSPGSHQISVGFEYGRGADTVTNNFRANGRFTFNSAAPFTGDAFADFLIGKFYSIQQGAGEYRDTRFNRIAAFVNDSYKVNRRLTLDLGVRWEPFLPYTDLNDKVAVWEPGKQSTRFENAPPGVLFAGDAGVPAGGVNKVWTRFAPRAGFAWDVFGDGRTSVRGGYGIFYDSPDTLAMNNQADQAPYGTVVTVFGNSLNNINNPYAGTVNPFPVNHSNTSQGAAFPPYSTQWLYASDYRSAYVQSWNFSIEREVTHGFITRISYAGSKGTRLTDVRELNPAVYAPGVSTSTTDIRRPFAPGLGSASIVEPIGNSSYHALQITGEKRFSHGFSLLANYQYSKAIDDSSAGKNSSQSMTNPFNQHFDKGPADFDKTHVVNVSGLWDLPVHFHNRIVNSLLGGWSLNGILSMWSGFPFTVTSGVDNARTGTGGQRADLMGDPTLPGNRSRAEQVSQWLNPDAFQVNAIGTFGNLGRNTFRGPGSASLDGGLFKTFAITERFNATFRFEAFNSLNRPNFAGPNTTVTSSNFMRTTSAYDPRILQFAVRLTW